MRGGFRLKNMWLHHERELDRQINEFVAYRATTCMPTANEYQEWLVIFSKVVGRNHIFELTGEDLNKFDDYVHTHYNGEYQPMQAHKCLRNFLKFYRCEHILKDMETNKRGRPVNISMVKKVRELKEKNLTFRDIQAILAQREGRKYDLKSLCNWFNSKAKI